MALKNAGKLLGTHPQLGAFALFAAARVQYDLWVDSGYRPNTEQDALYAQGRDKDGNVTGQVATNAKAGQSAHNYGLAVDLGPWAPERSDNLATADDPRYDELGALGQQFGLVWGGTFHLADGSSDPDHFELPSWPERLNWKATIAVAIVLGLLLVVALVGAGGAGGA